MKETYIKARVPQALHAAVRARAGREGLRQGTYLREAIERDLRAKAATAALTAEPAAAAASAPGAPDASTVRLLHELRLLLRELAMHQNAQILSRAAAQLNAQFPCDD